MTITQFKDKLNNQPNQVLFSETMQLIEDYYTFIPTAFTNGEVSNKAGENSGSCKVFAFALVQKLTEKETLICFGEHYRNVLEDSEGTSHQNIRNFMKFGFDGLTLANKALSKK